MPPKASTSASASASASASSRPKTGSTGTGNGAGSKKTSASAATAAGKKSAGGDVKPKVTGAGSGNARGDAGPKGSLSMSSLDIMIHSALLAAPNKAMSQAGLKTIPNLPENMEEIMHSINSMARRNLVKYGKNSRAELVFIAVPIAEAREMGSLDQDERIVLQHVISAGNIGIWTRTLKARSGLHQNVISRCIKTLEQKKSIKNVKSVKHPTRKIYMLYDMTPSIDVTGGPWYSGNELDTELIESLQKLAKRFIKDRTFPSGRPDMMWPLAHTPYLPTAHDLLDFIVSKNVLQIELNVEHIEAILDVLVYDNEIDKIWMRRFKADGQDEEPADLESSASGSRHGSVFDLTSDLPPGKDKGKGKEGNRKRKSRNADDGRSNKRMRRNTSVSSGDIDNDEDRHEEHDVKVDSDASTDSETLRNEVSEDEDYKLPKPLAVSYGMDLEDENGIASDVRSAHKRPGPKGNDYYWVYRTNLASLPTGSFTDDQGERQEKRDYIYDMGLTQTPCGICPVSEFCYNRGQPRVLPLPGERDLSENSSATIGYNATSGGSSDWRSAVKVKGKFTKAKDKEQAVMQELLKMKVPTGAGELENADGAWKGGGKVGGNVVAPVNPASCLYYNQWFGEHVEW